MSGSYAEALWRRAKAFLEEAAEARDPDLATFFAEQAMQLAIKAVAYELFGERIRGHGLRELLSFVVRRLESCGFGDEARVLRSFVAENRDLLIDAEEAYTLSRYGEASYDRETAERLVELARELLNLLEEVARRVKLG